MAKFQGKIREFDKGLNITGTFTFGPHGIVSILLHFVLGYNLKFLKKIEQNNLS